MVAAEIGTDPDSNTGPASALSLPSPSPSTPASSSVSPFWQDGDADISGICDLALEPWVEPQASAAGVVGPSNGSVAGGDGGAAAGVGPADGEIGGGAAEGALCHSLPASIQVGGWEGGPALKNARVLFFLWRIRAHDSYSTRYLTLLVLHSTEPCI